MGILALILVFVLVGGTFSLLLDLFVIRPLERYKKDRWYDRFL
ncbi:hypothetical protein [Xanthomonas phage BUDD]|nr:hypothetical protein [Xanthomonas phage BUDD]